MSLNDWIILKTKIKEELKNEIREELKNEMREELKKEIREELKKEMNVDEWRKEIKVEKDIEDEPKKEELEGRKEVKQKRRSAKLDRVIHKKKILPSILPRPMLKKNMPIFSIRKSAKPVAITSYEVVSSITCRNQPSATPSCDTAGRAKKAIAAPPTRKPKEPSKGPKMDSDVEVVEFKKRRNNQEVTEAVPKVIKTEVDGESNDENQNLEDTILCGMCSKPFSKNAGALVAHGETHGGKFGGKGKRWCTQCPNFEGDRTHLLMHMRAKHTKEKLFKCCACNDSFATCAAKKIHEKRH